MAEHTPLPWEADAESTMGTTIYTVRHSGQDIAALCWNDDDEVAINEANAEFIIRAVNCHHDLLESLATLLGACETDAMDHKSNVYRSAMIAARAAIAKAEGK